MTRQMIDSAYPMKTQPQPLADIVLIYAGGDTPHTWTTAEILAMPNRYRWPCWVRSDPQDVNVAADASQFIAWLTQHQVPLHTAVILDLETAVATSYVKTFNGMLRTAGYLVTKYGSSGFIWKNPKTDGGTFVAEPGHANAMDPTGDTVAVQYAFDGAFDRSVVVDQDKLALWDTKPKPSHPHPFPSGRHVADGTEPLSALAKRQGCDVADIWWATVFGLDNTTTSARFGPLERAYLNVGDWKADMPKGMVLWLP